MSNLVKEWRDALKRAQNGGTYDKNSGLWKYKDQSCVDRSSYAKEAYQKVSTMVADLGQAIDNLSAQPENSLGTLLDCDGCKYQKCGQSHYPCMCSSGCSDGCIRTGGGETDFYEAYKPEQEDSDGTEIYCGNQVMHGKNSFGPLESKTYSS